MLEAATATLDSPIVGGGVSVVSATISIGASAFLFPGGTTGGVFYRTAPTVTFALPTGSGNAAEATATLDELAQTGGTVETLAITTGGKFYTSAPTVTISHPGTSTAQQLDLLEAVLIQVLWHFQQRVEHIQQHLQLQ